MLEEEDTTNQYIDRRNVQDDKRPKFLSFDRDHDNQFKCENAPSSQQDYGMIEVNKYKSISRASDLKPEAKMNSETTMGEASRNTTITQGKAEMPRYFHQFSTN